MRRFSRVCAMTLVLSTGVACGKKDATTSAPAASALAPSTGLPGAKFQTFDVDPLGKTMINMPAPKEHIKADTTVAGGHIDVDPTNLSNTRGEVKVDLLTLKTRTFEDAKKNDSQTTHAHNWLEVGDQVTPEMREGNRWVLFAIRSIDNVSVPDISKAPVTTEGGDDIREVSLGAHGEFLLHGHKVNKDVSLGVEFHYPHGAPSDGKAAFLIMKTKTPLKITLAEHDVKPRDSFGKIAQGSFSLLGTKVAETADVVIDLRATPSKDAARAQGESSR